MMAKAATTFAAVSFLSLWHVCDANAFLKKYDVAFMASQGTNAAEVEKNLLEEIKGYMRQGVQDEHLRETQEVFEPIWPALPKNEFGNLDSATARYALHRFFVQRHGWHIRGLESDTAANATDGAPSGSVMKDKVPGFLLELFKKALNGRGFRMDSLVVLASTIERLIHEETSDRLQEAYAGLGLSTASTSSLEEAQTAMEAYAASIIGGSSLPPLSKLKPGQVKKLLVKFGKRYPAWADTQMWLRDVENTEMYLTKERTNSFKEEAAYSIADVQSFADAVAEGFGSFQNLECRHLKDTLLEAEEGDTGRVKLSNFYKKNLESGNSWYFAEPVEQLRAQGALEEKAGFGEPRVLVANYLTSQGNCLGDSGFYSICCINECDGIVAKLEKQINAPRAPPAQIARLVAEITSDTVDAPRTLSPQLLQRLNEVAKSMDGQVVLHSRLFQQWMHFAFPRECPKVSFTTSKELQKGGAATVTQSKKDIKQYVDNAQTLVDNSEESFFKMESLYVAQDLPQVIFGMKSAGKFAAMGGLGLVASTQLVKNGLGMGGSKVAGQFNLPKEHFV